MSAITRRRFLRGSLLTSAGLVIAFHVPRRALAAAAGAPPEKPPPDPNAFLRIAPDESVTVMLAHSEMGQGIWTTLAMLVAEELECDWSRVRVEHAPAAPAYAHTAFGMQMTGGSSTTWSEFDRYRTVGAMARDMLVRAAAERWKVDPGRLRAARGHVHRGREKISYGQLAGEAAKLPAPGSVKLKQAKDWKLVGKPMRRLDGPEKVTGRAQFGIDVKLPGLRTAVVARAPVFGAKLKAFDATKARAVPGVEKVVVVPSGVAVVAGNFWSAATGREALKVDWDLGSGASLDSETLKASYRALARTPGLVALDRGDADAGLAAAARRLEAEFDVPYLAHAPMEPLNCTVRIEGDRCDVWTGTQMQTMDQGVAAHIAGLPPQNVSIHTPFLGGGFGRRANPRADFVSEAVHVARAAGVPVKVVWTREDDIRGGFYRPAFVHRVEVGADAKGRPIAWRHTIVGQSIIADTPFEAMLVKDGIDRVSVEGVVDSPYLEGVGACRVWLHSPKNEVPVLWWRSVGHTHTAFAMESVIDDLAHAAGRDRLEFRAALLADKPRHLRALKVAAQKAGWGKKPPAGRARGLAVHESFGSIVAEVAEVSAEKGAIRVHKVTCAVDCGLAVNPLAVEAQVQGAVAFGLGPVLRSELTLKEGRVQQSNFHDYEVLRLDEMPEVEVHILPSKARMGGIGEPATAPVAPAVANAVFALTGKRLRSLPLRLA
ncbi:MAG TPA: molybdopterin cofactor-binding domain-containing protein [Anaeromyxobacteraceae bacterium]|jgi:isoquinoline 1-oxidoreductase beta subunit